HLAKTYVLAGNLKAAEDSLNRALTFVSQQKTPGANTLIMTTWAEAAVAEARGDLLKAENGLRKAIRISRENKKTGNQRFVLTSELARVLARQGRLLEAENAAREAILGFWNMRKDHWRKKGKWKRLKNPTLTGAGPAPFAHRLSTILYEQGRYREAEKIARASIHNYQLSCTPANSVEVAQARRSLAESLAAQEQWTEAAALFETIKESMGSDQFSFEALFAGDPTWALALLNDGREAEALDMLKKAHGKLGRQLGAKHYETAETQGILAIALARTGAPGEALAAFGESVAILLKRSRQSSKENTSQAVLSQRRGMILDAYIGLLADVRGTDIERRAGIDAALEAFTIADVARSRTVQGALAASGARAAAGNPDLADLVRREQDAKTRIAALSGTLANLVAAGSGNKHDKTEIRKQIDDLRNARATLIEEIEGRFPDYAELINPKPATLQSARASLSPGEALIATYVSRDRTYVWALPESGAMAFASLPMGREEIGDMVAELRVALAPQAQALGDIPEFDVGLSHKLFGELLEPVREGWKDAESLLVVAHGALGQLPFSVLVTEPFELGPVREPLFARYRDVPWLAKVHSVTVLPSVSSLASLRALPPANPDRRPFAGFGDPWFSLAQAQEAAKPKATRVAGLTSRGVLKVRGLPVRLRAAPKTSGLDDAELARLPRLPDTAEEVRSIALALNADLTRDVFTGAEATEEMIKSMDLSGYKVLAFATHGLVPGDLNGLRQPALAFTSPKLSGGGGDGLLTMGEILELKLDADWVVLSACNTAAGDGAGAEAFSGLGRAFFYAGTRALLLSNWPVETTSAKALTTDLFRRQAENPALTRAEALRQAMVGLIDGPGYVDEASGKTVFSYAHPIFWAPFTLIGDGGGGRPAS
ncbi:MAG: CHAT domain-containing protein, partial [Proteobacteria bacterium]|nr:CHAT domain-containing protein [Pseudomonadota bacterium]